MLAASSVAAIALWRGLPDPRERVPVEIAAAERVLHDSVSSRLFQLAEALPDDASVYAAPRATIIAHPEEALKGLTGEAFYPSVRGGPAQTRERAMLLQVLQFDEKVEEIGTAQGHWVLYLIMPPEPAAEPKGENP